jgi:hypothetical protein
MFYRFESHFQRIYTVESHMSLFIQGVSKKTLWKFNRLSRIINVQAKQFNFYIGRKNSYLAFNDTLFK